jgi:hypothetical protein
MYSSNSNTFNYHNYISSNALNEIIRGHEHWIRCFIDNDWDAYLISVLFHQLPGSREAKLAQMQQAMSRFYSNVATAMVRKPSSPNWAGYLPVGVFVPDFPVPKYSKDQKKATIQDVTINDGLHRGGIVLANRWVRTSNLAKHVEAKRKLYVTGIIRELDVTPITRTLEAAVDYTFKSVKRRTSSPADVLVLNWGKSATRPNGLTEALRKALKLDNWRTRSGSNS